MDKFEGEEEIVPRQSIMRHARRMESKLRAGDDLSKAEWVLCQSHSLMDHLMCEVNEIIDAYNDGCVEDLSLEAADVSLLCMMIVDNLEHRPESRGHPARGCSLDN